MHILHLVKTSSGATWAVRLIEEMIKATRSGPFPLTFSVVVPSGGKHLNLYRQLCRNVYEFDFDLGIGLLKKGQALREIVKQDQPDLIHSWFTQTTLYARLFLRDFNIPRVFQVVGPAHLESSLFRIADLKSADHNDYWVGTSEYICKIYKDAGILPSKLFLNYAFVDPERLIDSRDTVEKSDLRKELGIGDDVKIIGTASYIYPPKFYQRTGIKGHEYLLKAFSEILELRKDVVLVVAGGTFGSDDSYERKLKRRAREISRDRIFFTGKFEHVYGIISNFDVFVYLSKSENLGGVYESLLFEIPTISSNRGALPELVVDGETGFVVDLENNNDIVKKILTMIDTPHLQFGAAGKRRVMQIFDNTNIVNSAIGIYNEVLADHMKK